MKRSLGQKKFFRYLRYFWKAWSNSQGYFCWKWKKSPKSRGASGVKIWHPPRTGMKGSEDIDILPLDSRCLYQLMFTPEGTSVCLQRLPQPWCKIILGALVIPPCCFLISSSLSITYLSISLPTLACQSMMQNFSSRGLRADHACSVHSPCI
jgi:hypothetical protein